MFVGPSASSPSDDLDLYKRSFASALGISTDLVTVTALRFVVTWNLTLDNVAGAGQGAAMAAAVVAATRQACIIPTAVTVEVKATMQEDANRATMSVRRSGRFL